MTDDRYERVTFHGRTVDRYTMAALLEAEKRLGYELTITQGSYNTGVGASAGTHDGGGTVDLAAWDYKNKVEVLRRIGFAAWYRPYIAGLWPAHIHAVLIGNAKLAPVAARQVDAYRAGRDGLAGNRVDNTWRPSPIPTFQYPPKAPPPPPPTAVSKARRRFEQAQNRMEAGLLKLEAADEDRTVAHNIGAKVRELSAELDALLDRMPKR